MLDQGPKGQLKTVAPQGRFKIERNGTVTPAVDDEVTAPLKGKGLQFVDTDATTFRATLKKAGFYEEWRGKFGPEAWGVLEKSVGSLA